MDDGPFVAHGQNFEDVVLWRALKRVHAGHYVDVGCGDPNLNSVTRSFYDRGWSGVTVDASGNSVAEHVASRPRDLQVYCTIANDAVSEPESPISRDTHPSALSSVVDDALGDAGSAGGTRAISAMRLDSVLESTNWSPTDIQFIVINDPGNQYAILKSIDLSRWRPWVLVVNAMRPDSAGPDWESWEGYLLSSGYQFCLFDGMSRFYVSDEKSADLKSMLSYPACVLDGFVPYRSLLALSEQAATFESEKTQCSDELDALVKKTNERERELVDKVRQWRRYSLELKAENDALKSALPSHNSHLASSYASVVRTVHNKLAATRGTPLWRITKPLRVVRKLGSGIKGF